MHCKNFISWVERNTGLKVKRVHNDKVLEFLGLEKDFDKNASYLHICSVQPTLEWLGRRNELHLNGEGQRNDERCKHTFEIGEALNHGATLHNCAISTAMKDINAHESLFRSVPNCSKMRIFECTDHMNSDKES